MAKIGVTRNCAGAFTPGCVLVVGIRERTFITRIELVLINLRTGVRNPDRNEIHQK